MGYETIGQVRMGRAVKIGQMLLDTAVCNVRNDLNGLGKIKCR